MLYVDGSNVSDVCACVKDLDLLCTVGENLVNYERLDMKLKRAVFF